MTEYFFQRCPSSGVSVNPSLLNYKNSEYDTFEDILRADDLMIEKGERE